MITSQEIIEEIRESRRRMSADCGHDVAKYVEQLKRFNQKFSQQVEEYRKQQESLQAERTPRVKTLS